MTLLMKSLQWIQTIKDQRQLSQAPVPTNVDELNKLLLSSRSLSSSIDSLTLFVKNTIENMETVSQSIHGIVTSATQQSAEAEKSLQDSEKLGEVLQASVVQIRRMEQVVSDTLQASQSGQATVKLLSEESVKNSEISNKLQQTMNDLEHKSDEISKALNLIFNVSNNIQLLALNASIEAAHAGEHGRGFAVVAQEVRRLAQESATNGQQIRGLLQTIQNQIQDCSSIVKVSSSSSHNVSQVVEQTQQQFEAINHNLSAVTEYTGQVSELLNSANQGKELLIQNIHHVASLAQESLSAAYEVAYLSESQASSVLSVAGASQDLQQASNDIKISVTDMIPEQTKVAAAPTLHTRIGFMANLTHAPALLATRNQLFAQHLAGQYETRTFSAGPSLVNALLNNQIDIGYTGPSPVFEAFVKQPNIRIIAGASQGGAALLVGTHSKVKEVHQLQGKVIAIPQYGNGQHILLRHLLRRYGLKDVFRGGNIRIIQVKPSALFDLFNRNEIDAALVPEPWVSILESKGAATVLSDWRDLFNNGLYPNTIVAVRHDYYKEHPEQVQQFLQAHHEALRIIHAGQPQTYEIISQELQSHTGQALSSQSIQQALTRIIWNPDADLASLQQFAALIKQEGFLSKTIDFDLLLSL
ncbi:Methyl-accepting chemotaxis protein McpA [compost metagenome]